MTATIGEKVIFQNSKEDFLKERDSITNLKNQMKEIKFEISERQAKQADIVRYLAKRLDIKFKEALLKMYK
ncbi:MAG: hypothetical protein HOI47_29195 [Candidatus Scalindua sp.]|jgi:hypothetical protein|nr:hypothetical protein [Candidatus Scalindua sp.]